MDELELSLMESLRKANLTELGADVSDKALEALGGVPVVGLLQKFWKVACSVPTYLFLKKMVRFLAELKDIPQEERQAQIERLEGDAKEEKKVGETLLLVLESLNDMQKPRMVGRAFKALLKNEITEKEFAAICHAIDTLSIKQIADAARFYKSYGRGFSGGQGKALNSLFFYHNKEAKDEDTTSLQAMAICGLVSVDWGAKEEMKGTPVHSKSIKGEIWYYTTGLGFTFYKVIFEEGL